MKRLIVISAVLASALQAQWFVGVDYPLVSSMSSDYEIYSGESYSGSVDYEYKPFTLKIGAGDSKGSNWNFYYSSEKIEYEGGKSNKPLNEFGWDYRWGFNVDAMQGKFTPFIQTGISYGWQDDYFDGEDGSNVGVKLGIGVNYMVTPKAQLVLGLDYKYRGWTDVDSTDEEDGYYREFYRSDSGTKLYVGFNYWFGTSNITQKSVQTSNLPVENNKQQVAPSTVEETDID
jgi:opacity protein-like surface antigen